MKKIINQYKSEKTLFLLDVILQKLPKKICKNNVKFIYFKNNHRYNNSKVKRRRDMSKILPVMLLKNLLLLPDQEVKLELNNDLSRKIIELSRDNFESQVLIVCPKNDLEEIPDVDDLGSIGVVGIIKSKIDLPNGHQRVKLLGLKRVKIDKYYEDKTDEILKCHYKEIEIPEIENALSQALKRKIISNLKKYIKASPNLSNSILNVVDKIESLDVLTDLVSTFLPLSTEKKIIYMEEIHASNRAEQIIKDLEFELQVIKLDQKIENSLRIELEQNQKEFILHEKIKEIEKELGEEDYKKNEIEIYQKHLESLLISPKTKAKIEREIKKYDLTPEMSPDSSIIRNYLDWILYLPWNNIEEEKQDLEDILDNLNKTHYGLEEIKERIIEYVAVKNYNKDIRCPILCFVGPPGVGKTSIAISIARSLEKEFYKISVGGLSDSNELNGHRKTYMGASPGKIIQGLKKCGTKNPLFLIDEVDKMVKDYKGDPASVLLEILDPEQNKYFTDNYIEEPFDLSKIFFILTANDKYKIPNELRDRLEIIELSSYTLFEKLDIAKNYLLPKVLKEHGLKENDLKMSDTIMETMINHYTKEAGVRELERILSTIVRKSLTEALKEKIELKKNITKKTVTKFLGEFKYVSDNVTKKMTPGLVYGLAYTPVGGAVLPIESCAFDGDGKISFTGSLGKVMEESINVAISYIKSHKEELKIDDYFFERKNIHLHALEGAIPKDGPSAGITITTSLISLMTGIMLPQNIAMTGEITLRGDILPIGGLKEKLIGAYNERIKKVFIPKKNHSDLEEIPITIKENIEIIEVNNYREIYRNLFQNPTK